MDPDETLRALRAALTDYDETIRKDVADQAADRVLEAARALDGWLSRGGFLPTDWARS